MSQDLMTPAHYRLIKEAKTHADLLKVAEEVLKMMDGPVSMVCGPISTGGLGCINKNITRFRQVIHHLQGQGYNICLLYTSPSPRDA